MRKHLLNFLFIVFCFCLVCSCSSAGYNGVFVGTMTAETKSATQGQGGGATTEDEKDVMVMLKQEGNDVLLTINKSRLLGDCSLRARLNKNKTAYIDDPQYCSNSLPLTGSLTLSGDELLFTLNGLNEYTSQQLRFRGVKK